MLAAEPDSFDIDGLRKIPDLLGGVDGIGVVGMHDPGVIEDDVNAAPRVELVDHGGHIGFFGHISFERFEPRMVREDGVDFGESARQGRLRYIGHEDGGPFTGEEDGRFETNPAME